MKRMLIGLMVLVLCGLASGQYLISTSDTTPTMIVCMRSDTTGLPVAGLTVTNFKVSYAPNYVTYMSTELTGESTAYNATWAEPTATKVGVFERIKSGSTGYGSYRIYLPAAFMTNAEIHMQREVFVTDAVGSARAVCLVIFNPPTDADTAGGIALPAITVNAGVIEANVASIDTGIAGADVWNSLWTSYTTQNSFGRILKQIYYKVMSLR